MSPEQGTIEFFWRCWDAARGFGGEIGGDTVQEWGEKLGLLKKVAVDAPCGDGCVCDEYGDFPMDCYRPTVVRGDRGGVGPCPHGYADPARCPFDPKCRGGVGEP